MNNTMDMSEQDIKKIIAADICSGTRNIRDEMKPYIWGRAKDGVHIFDIKKFWDKLVLAARVLVAIENPADIACLSGRPYGQRAVLKFASFTGAQPLAGKYTAGTFTNQITNAYCEPRILVCQDPRVDIQPITEGSYTNIPVIAFCNSDTNLKNVDIAIPCNNLSKEAIGTCWWLLCRQLMKFRGKIPADSDWDVMPDLFFYRDPEEQEVQEEFVAEPQAKAGDEWGQTAAVADPNMSQPFENFGDANFQGDWADVDYNQTTKPTAGADGVTPGQVKQVDPNQTYQQTFQDPNQQFAQPAQPVAAQQAPQGGAQLPNTYFPPEENLEAW